MSGYKLSLIRILLDDSQLFFNYFSQTDVPLYTPSQFLHRVGSFFSPPQNETADDLVSGRAEEH